MDNRDLSYFEVMHPELSSVDRNLRIQNCDANIKIVSTEGLSTLVQMTPDQEARLYRKYADLSITPKSADQAAQIVRAHGLRRQIAELRQGGPDQPTSARDFTNRK